MSSDFIRKVGWDFASGVEGWSVVNGSLNASGGVMALTTDTVQPLIRSPAGLSINGAIYDKVQARVRRTNLSDDWVPRLQYETGAHGLVVDYRKDLASRTADAEFTILEWDMSQLTAGGDDWRNSIITRFDIRFQGADIGSVFEVDSVAVGRRGSTLMQAISWRSVVFKPSVGQQMSGQADGVLLTQNLRPPLWQGQLMSNQMGHEAFSAAQALIESLDGSRLSFHVWNPIRMWPSADPKGAALGAAAVTIHAVGADNHTMRLAGLPVGYVLTRGDMLAFDYGVPPHRALHRIVSAAAIADAGGVTPMFEVYPHLRPGAAAGQAVTLVRPAMEAIIPPGTYEPQAVAVRGQLSLSVLQVA